MREVDESTIQLESFGDGNTILVASETSPKYAKDCNNDEDDNDQREIETKYPIPDYVEEDEYNDSKALIGRTPYSKVRIHLLRYMITTAGECEGPQTGDSSRFDWLGTFSNFENNDDESCIVQHKETTPYVHVSSQSDPSSRVSEREFSPQCEEILETQPDLQIDPNLEA